MKIELSKAEEEDARLTAYALGELDPADAASVESQLKESAESREALEEIRSTVALLSAEFSKEPELSLHEEQVEAITGDGKIVPGSFLSRNSHWLSMGAVAACACLFAAVGMKQYIGGLEQKDVVSVSDRVLEAPELASAPMDREMEELKDQDADPLVQPGAGEQEAASKVQADPKGRAVGNVVGTKLDSSAVEPVEMPSRDASKQPEGASRLEAADESAGQVMPGKNESAVRTSGSRGRPADGVDGEKMSDAIRPVAAPVPKAVAEKPAGIGKAKESKRPAPTSAPAAAPMKPMVESEAVRRKAVMRRSLSKSAPSVRGGEARGGAGAAPEPQPAEASLAGRAGKLAESDDLAFDKATATRSPKKRLDDAGAAGESYGQLVDNPWVRTWDDGLSTFAIDVDTGTYPNVRRFLTRRAALPPKDAVRIEEMINYFNYDYPEPDRDVPFSVNMEVASCPWAKGHRLLRVGLRGRRVDIDKRPPSNLVFLIDVSGSMRGAEKLDLLKRSMKAMVGQLNEDDRVGIVTYAGNSGVVLEPTHGDLKDKITGALDRLEAGGSTNGASGIAQAYSLAKANFVEGTNRVILATDGDFNVGVTNSGDLVRMVEDRAGEKIFLTVLGFGQGNLQEHRMEQIADKGNGSYHYIDSEKEGEKVLVHGLGATLVTVAKDVKVQLDFNPGKVAKYRLLGYANRMLPDEAFNDPAADAGEIGAGHTVTALYEIVPTAPDAKIEDGPAAGSRYRERGALVQSDELVTLKLNYKLPEDDQVAPTIEVPLVDPGKKWVDASEDFRFAAAVAGFGLLLRDSDYAGMLNYDLVLELGSEGIPEEKRDPLGLRTEFLDLVKKAKSH